MPYDYDPRDHFVVLDVALKHPDGRAKGGEPCVQCKKPIPASAHWKQRDRHVCSSRCNINLVRRLNANKNPDLQAQRADAVKKVAAIPNPRSSDAPRVFRTVPDQYPPFEWEGYGPLPGDVVERYGVTTVYTIQDVDLGIHTRPTRIAWAASGDALLTGTGVGGFQSRLVLGQYTAGGEMLTGETGRTFLVDGVECEWRLEIITDLHRDGLRHLTWETWVAAPVTAPPHPASLQSPQYRAEMDRRARTSSNTTRHARRALDTAVIEDFDPHEVFERDGWFCQLCGTAVDRTILYPDLLSASLDHTRPLILGGDHTRENTQLAHLGCNIRKSDTWAAG